MEEPTTYYEDYELDQAYNNGFDSARDTDKILMNNLITLAASLSYDIARNEIFQGNKGIDFSKVERYLKEDEHFTGLPEEVIQHFIEVLTNVLD